MKRSLGYLDGIGATLAGLSLLSLAWFAFRGGDLERMYRELGGEIPTVTRVVLHPVWRTGMPLMIVGAIAFGHIRVTRFALLAIGILSVATVVVTYVAAWAPITALAGNIR